MSETSQIFALEKSIWTENDYSEMGWHDSRIYAFAFFPNDELWGTNLVFDIDYIFKWVQPVVPDEVFSFWVAPCSLLFKKTFNLEINIDRKNGMTDMFEIADLLLIDKVEQEKNTWIYEWKIELQDGEIQFKSFGFEQFVKQRPIFTNNQILTLEERNGINFNLSHYKI